MWGLSPCMGSGEKPVTKNSFRTFQRAKMSPQDTQLNTISYIFLQRQIKYSKTSLKGPLKKKTKTWDSRPIIAYLMQVLSIAECS